MAVEPDIAVNLQTLRAEINTVAHAAGRDPREITLIAVSKNQPLSAVEAAALAGQCHFGESTTQDASSKIPFVMNRNLVWHFIGHLQSNKARFLPGNFQWLHSLDSDALARRVSRFSVEKDCVIDSLIEVNVTGDQRKHGVTQNRLFPLLDVLLREELPGIRLRGLMAIGPYPATEKEIRAIFSAARELRDQARKMFALERFDQLSMGMSGDYAEAVKEGSTMVRIGSAIFGERDYSR